MELVILLPFSDAQEQEVLGASFRPFAPQVPLALDQGAQTGVQEDS